MNSKALLVTVALLLAVGSALGFFWPFGNSDSVLRLHGIVEIQEVRLGSKVGGRVADVLVKEGQTVEAGRELVLFEEPELEAQKEQLQARLEAARAEYDKAVNGPRRQEREAAVAQAGAAKAHYEKLKAGWREEEKRQARSELDAAQADLKQAEEDFARTADLYRQRSASRSEYDSAWANRDRARGRVNAAKARHDMLTAGNRAEDIDIAYFEWEQARANADLLKEGTRPEDKAAAKARLAEVRAKLREVEINLAERVVKAPERAVVEVVAVRKGDVVAPNQPVVRVLRAEDLWVKVFVPETELGKVRLNQDVEVLIDSYPGHKFQGKVTQVASISEFTPRNVQSADERRHQVFAVKVTVKDTQGVFKSGMAAEVHLPLHGAPK
jgi:multidrug resistance efflux pump